MVVRIGLVELEHGELGVVLGGDTFVAEVAIDLVDAIESADDKALQVKLRCDAQEERHVQRVVVGGEGPGHRSTGDGLHHRSFDFHVATVIEEAANGAQYLGALHKDGAHIGVDEQVQIALAIAQLHILEAVILLRQREHGLGEEGDGVNVHRELAGAGAEEIAGDADVVAEVEQLVKLKGLLAYCVEPHIDLEPLAALLELREAGLALGADGHDASGDGDIDALGLELLGGPAVELRAQRGDLMRGAVMIGIGGVTQRGDLLQLLLPQRKEAALEL